MKLRKLAWVALASAALALAVLPSTASARNIVGGAGYMTAVDVEESTITVKGREIRVSRTASLYDAGGRRIDLEELASFEGEEVHYTAYTMGRRLLLKTLNVGEDDEA